MPNRAPLGKREEAMKFTCEVATLKRALALLKLDEPKAHLSITAQAAQLQFRCYTDDGNFCIDATIPAEVEISGTVTISAEALPRICEYTTNETLRFSHHERHGCLDIEGEQHQHVVHTYAEKWQDPALKELTDVHEYEIPASQFGRALNTVLFASEKPSDAEGADQRASMWGVLFHRHDGEDRIVTTDGKRMAVLTLSSARALANTEAPVPKRAMAYKACVKMVDLIESLEPEACRLHFTENAVGFEVEGVVLRCIWPSQANFPNYLSIVERAEKSPTRVEVKVNRERLLWALQIIHVEDNPDRRTEFCFSDGQLTVANNTHLGKSGACVPIQYVGSEIVIAVDSWFFEEPLLHTDAHDVTLWLHPDAENFPPIHLQLAQNLRYLVMPLK